MICAGCGHSARDHATGRCVHSQMRYVASVGGTVTTSCRCFEFLEEIPENDLPPLVIEVEEPAPAEMPEEPVNIATRVRTPKSGKRAKK